MERCSLGATLRRSDSSRAGVPTAFQAAVPCRRCRPGKGEGARELKGPRIVLEVRLLGEGRILHDGSEIGMISQEMALRALLKKNLITQEEALRKSIRPEELKKVMALPY